MSKRKQFKDKKDRRSQSRRNLSSAVSIEEAGQAYVLKSRNPRNQRNFEELPRDVTRLPTKGEVHRKKNHLPSYCQLVLMPMFAAMSKITDNLFLTSVGGMTQENFEKYKIGCIINATYEAPNLKQPGIESIRVPVDDSENDNIGEFFDVIADKLHEKASEKINSVVHCVAGISRSTTLVMAYLMKYHKMDIRTSFNHIHSRRPIVRPNNSFFKQLMTYEMKLFNKNSCKMINLRLNGVEIEVPDFFQNDHKGFIVLDSLKAANRKRKNEGNASGSTVSKPTADNSPVSGISGRQESKDASKIGSPSKIPEQVKAKKDDDQDRTMMTNEEKRREELIKRFVTNSYNDEDIGSIIESSKSKTNTERKNPKE